MSYKTDEEHSQPYVDEIESSYESILKNIGEDTTRNGIVKTPERAAKAMQFLTQMALTVEFTPMKMTFYTHFRFLLLTEEALDFTSPVSTIFQEG